VECVEASPEEAEDGSREGSDSEDEVRLYGKGKEAAPSSDAEGDGSAKVAEEPEAKKAPRPKVGSAARPYRAKQWVDELRPHLTGTQMWCHLTKRGNLNLCTINVNGKPMGWELQRLLLQLSNGSDCPIDGFVLIDTRTPEEQVGFQTREWQAVFGEKELVIRVLSGKHKDEGERKINGQSLVGGSTLLFFPRPGLRVRDVTYDPANLGILTCVIISIGPTDSVLWIAAYIPCKGGKEEGNGLEAKLRAWYFKTRAPSLVDGKEKSEGDRKFDAISWIWDFLLSDRVARSQMNQSHVGVILTGDLNQRLDNSDQSRRSLRVRTEAMGLYANLAERFQHLDSEYSTWGRGRLVGGGWTT
jgi:hypothetical protein